MQPQRHPYQTHAPFTRSKICCIPSTLQIVAHSHVIVGELLKIVSPNPEMRVGRQDCLVGQSSQILNADAFPCIKKIAVDILQMQLQRNYSVKCSTQNVYTIEINKLAR